MADQIFIRPAREGLIVRDPISKQALPDAGVWVSMRGQASIYWRRRIACGDVLVGELPKEEPVVKLQVEEPVVRLAKEAPSKKKLSNLVREA